jgi:uncharacterized protein
MTHLKLPATLLTQNNSQLKQTIIIAAISSRIYVQAAIHAGFEVIALDAFCDVDTQKIAKNVIKILLKNGQFVADDFLQTLQKIDLTNVFGLCFGAGSEAQPALLAEIAKFVPVFGNLPETVQYCKNPQLFAAFCEAYQMPTPAIQFSRPINTIGWVQKQIGGSGGAHIKPVFPLEIPNNQASYFQKIQAGTPVSCLFLSDGKNAQVIGFNEQLCNSTRLLPYRYGGVVSHYPLPDKVKTAIENFVQNAAKYLQLVGLNSADFIVEGETVYALEINPRLSASLDCYSAKKGDLFAAHVAACVGDLSADLRDWPIVDKQSRAHFVVYAHQAISVATDMQWPDWVRDIPQANSEIAADAPICTVVADARTAKRAKQKLFERVRDL